jgi:hypothetical protein
MSISQMKRRKRRMYRILLKMKKMYKHEDWLKMVEQAHERGKLTDQEYQELINLEEEEA